MVKSILSPLFLIIVAVVALQVYGIVKARRTGMPATGAAVVTIVCLVLLALFSMPVFNRCIYAVMESGVSDRVECPYEIVVVLGGGYFPGSEGESDVLNDESLARVKKGAYAYKACGAKYLVVSGHMNTGKADRHCTLMAEFANGLGVPASAIALEKDSQNSRDHPLFLEKMAIVDKDARIAVITSPWHMKRAMREFERIFPNAVGVAAYSSSYAKGSPIGALDWVPMAMALERTTRPFHEIIGMVWYGLANFLQDRWGVDIDRYRK